MATIQGIYIALFGRPADPAGLAFFNEATNNGADLTAIGDLASTDEYQSRFTGMSNEEIVNSIYQSLFGRDGEQAGIDFFVAGLEDGTFNINNIAIAILDGAQGDDLATVNAKIAAANIFTANLDQQVEIDAYAGADAAQIGRDFIDGVNKDDQGTEAEANAAILLLLGDEGQGPGNGPGTGGGGGGSGGANPSYSTLTLAELLAYPAGAEPANYNLATTPGTEDLGTLDAANYARIGGLLNNATNEADYAASGGYTVVVEDSYENILAAQADLNADAGVWSVVLNDDNDTDTVDASGLTMDYSVFGLAGNDTITTAAGNDHYIDGGAGVDTINLAANAGDDVIALATASADRDVINAFETGFDDLEINDGNVTADISGGVAGHYGEHVAAPSGGFGAVNLAAASAGNAVVEITGLSVWANLAAATDGSELLDGFSNTLDLGFLGQYQNGQKSGFTVSNDWNGYLVAYDNGNAYVYYADANGNTTLTESEISLVATVNGVAAGSLDETNFFV